MRDVLQMVLNRSGHREMGELLWEVSGLPPKVRGRQSQNKARDVFALFPSTRAGSIAVAFWQHRSEDDRDNVNRGKYLRCGVLPVLALF